jgi:hypothetical protein
MSHFATNNDPDLVRTVKKADGTSFDLYFPLELNATDYLRRILLSIQYMLRPIYSRVCALPGIRKMKHERCEYEEDEIDLHYLLKHMSQNQQAYLLTIGMQPDRFKDYIKFLANARNFLAHDNQVSAEVYMEKCFHHGLELATASHSAWAQDNLYSLQKQYERHMSSKAAREKKHLESVYHALMHRAWLRLPVMDTFTYNKTLALPSDLLTKLRQSERLYIAKMELFKKLLQGSRTARKKQSETQWERIYQAMMENNAKEFRTARKKRKKEQEKKVEVEMSEEENSCKIC